MPDKFDPYREALIVEENTIWPDEFEEFDADRRQQIETALHADPANCGQLEYIRMHTGFLRQITVTTEDVERIG